MTIPARFIEKRGKPTHAVIPIKTYRRLVDELDELAALRAYDRYKAGPPRETIPAAVVYALADGKNPVRVWRMHRRLTQAKLAARCGIAVPYLSQIETGKRQASSAVLKRLASTLGITVDELI
jgi:DNA-binding XRE family transcriptional regulator